MADSQSPENINFLREHYKNIINSAVVKRKETSDAAIQEFERLLNVSMPTNAYERGVYDTVRATYQAVGGDYIYAIQRRNWQHYVLYTEGKNIVSMLRIRDIVYLQWNNEEKKYMVSRNKNSAPRQAETVESITGTVTHESKLP